QTGPGLPETTPLFQNVGSTTDYSGAFVGNANGTGVTLALAYKPSTGTGGQSFTVSDMGRFVGTVTAQWYDPTNRTHININGPFATSGPQTFTSPSTNSAGQNDFVLVLRAAATAPGAPTLSANPGDGKVSLSWTPASGAASYTILRGTSKGAETTTVASSM